MSLSVEVLQHNNVTVLQHNNV